MPAARNGQYEKDIMPQLYIDIEARFAKFQDGLNTIDRGARRVSGSVGAAFRGLQATIAALAVKQVFSELTTHALEAEKVVNKLNAALRSTGLSAGRSSQQIESLVDELVKSTQFDDEGIREAAASLIRFRDIQRETFDETLKLAPDVAAALGVPCGNGGLGRGSASRPRCRARLGRWSRKGGKYRLAQSNNGRGKILGRSAGGGRQDSNIHRSG